MKGITKFAKRTPHMLTSRVGMSSKSSDAQFDEMNRRLQAIEKFAEKLGKDAMTFRDAVKNMLLTGASFGTSFATLFQPIGSEYDLEKAHPNSIHTLTHLANYGQMMEELRETLTPEIELIESRVVAPIKDFEGILKAIRKNVTKRDHKLVDYDRINNSFTKLKDKKEKTLKDEQNLFKLEQEYEAASADYEYYNNAMKEELPLFFEKVKALMSPLFHSFYYMQLNVFYLTLDKVQTFADGRFDISDESTSVEQRYADALTDAAERLEELSIRKPAQASARVLQSAGRSPSLLSNSSSAGRAGTGGGGGSGLAAGAPSKVGLGRSPSSSVASPPPYASSSTSSGTASPSAGAGAGGTLKKAPPPPPPTKPKPGAAAPPPRDYVVALYDYAAQADGDLSFAAGDRIEVVERTGSTEDWWTGVLNGNRGVFPGNYVRDE